jgi:hypothetical protein
MAKSKLLAEFETLNQTTSASLKLTQEIAEQNAELARLARAQVEGQAKVLAVAQQQQLQLQSQTVQLQLQTHMMQLSETRARRQRDLKNAAFAIKRETEGAQRIPDVLVRMMTLLSLDEQARAADLQPSSIEEIADKEYVDVALRELGGAITATSGLLNAKHRQTIDWLNGTIP